MAIKGKPEAGILKVRSIASTYSPPVIEDHKSPMHFSKTIFRCNLGLLTAGLLLIACQKKIVCEDCSQNKPPVAVAGNDISVRLPLDSIVLDGTNSYDPESLLKSFSWSRIEGPTSFIIDNATGPKATLKNISTGVYQFELKVTDEKGLSGKDSISITVRAAVGNNLPPVAHAGPDQSITLPVSTITLDGSLSEDPDNNIIAYQWQNLTGPSRVLIADPNASQSQVFSFTEGVYEFQLKVIDAENLLSTDTVVITVHAADILVLCEPNRPIVDATLVRVGSLSEGRISLVSAAAGNKILFAGGMNGSGYSSRVDIYDVLTGNWSTAELTKAERQGMVAGTVGDKIFFAGGGDNDNGGTTTRIDIFDTQTNNWSTAELSQARENLATATLGDKIFFAGGTTWETNSSGYSTWVTSDIVDIYNNADDTWAKTRLSQARSDLSATTAGKKIYFAGGFSGPFLQNVSNRIDLYDANTDAWSVSNLEQPKATHASAFAGDKIFWAAGTFKYANNTVYPSNSVEIRNLNTGKISHVCIYPKLMAAAAWKGDNIVFFPGRLETTPIAYSGSDFDIYNTTTNRWYTGRMSREIYDATIISVHNSIYVAGGRDKPWGPYLPEVWRLEF